MSSALAVVEKLKALGVSITPEGNKIRLEPGSRVPAELVEAIRQHKAEILSILKPQTPLWHAQTIDRVVETEGVCLSWSDVLGEIIAFVEDDSQPVPAGVISYTSAELQELFQDKPHIPPETLRMIHQAKKAGGRVASREMEC